MNRKIAALALVASTLLAGACSGSNEPQAATDTTVADEPTTTWAPQDLELVPVQVTKPAPGTKVDANALPEELKAPAVGEVSQDQQDCMNGAMKAALDKDPTLAKTPGKRASLTGNAMAVCDASTAFTDPIVEQLKSGALNPSLKATDAQAECLKQAFAADKAATAKLISSSLVMGAGGTGDLEPLKQALAPFDTKCGIKVSAAFDTPPS